MKITGYELREHLKMKGIELNTLQSQWDESLFAFEDEKKMSPDELALKIIKLEAGLAALQTAQDYYNLQITVKVGQNEMLLAQAIKQVGGAGRLAKMWKSASQGETHDRWDRHATFSRKNDEVHAKPTITKAEALIRAKEAEKFASQIRMAIATGNTVAMDIDWVTEDLLS